jgi:hypothetical protein
MILRQKPENPQEYYAVDIDMHLKLSYMGVMALYM